MCGTVGLYLRNALVCREQFRAMNEAFKHQGPDDLGIVVDGPCELGMRRLSIIDLDGGHQPISSLVLRTLSIAMTE